MEQFIKKVNESNYMGWFSTFGSDCVLTCRFSPPGCTSVLSASLQRAF